MVTTCELVSGIRLERRKLSDVNDRAKTVSIVLSMNDWDWCCFVITSYLC